jgi:hypothetical protein
MMCCVIEHTEITRVFCFENVIRFYGKHVHVTLSTPMTFLAALFTKLISAECNIFVGILLTEIFPAQNLIKTVKKIRTELHSLPYVTTALTALIFMKLINNCRHCVEIFFFLPNFSPIGLEIYKLQL